MTQTLRQVTRTQWQGFLGQVTWRLQSGALKPLAAKLAKPWAEVTEAGMADGVTGYSLIQFVPAEFRGAPLSCQFDGRSWCRGVVMLSLSSSSSWSLLLRLPSGLKNYLFFVPEYLLSSSKTRCAALKSRSVSKLLPEPLLLSGVSKNSFKQTVFKDAHQMPLGRKQGCVSVWECLTPRSPTPVSETE